MAGHIRTRGHNYHFARDAEEGNIVPHCWHPFEFIVVSK
jgi:hypothetical protein